MHPPPQDPPQNPLNTALKIAFVTEQDISDRHAWSGSIYHIYQSLKLAGHQVIAIDNLKTPPISLFQRLQRKIAKKIFGKTLHFNRRESIVKGYAAEITERLKLTEYDLLFSPSSVTIALLEIDKPIVFWTDANFSGMIEYYPEFMNLTKRSRNEGNWAEQKGLSNCTLAIYASQWGVDTAVESYDVHPSKVQCIPFGANLNSTRTRSEIEIMAEKKSLDSLDLLFVGVDWRRKGGDLAFEITKELRTRYNIETKLHIVGCTPPQIVLESEFVVSHGFLSKKSEEENKRLEDLFLNSHFLLVPSLSECFGLVFCEASSFGLPSLARATGGIPTIIQEGKNGFLFDPSLGSAPYCEKIDHFVNSKSDYTDLVLSTFKEFEERLNWQSAGTKINHLLEKITQTNSS